MNVIHYKFCNISIHNHICSLYYHFNVRIGLAIARRLAQDGAKVMLSSRKQTNVDKAVRQLKAENLDVAGVVCHVGNPEHRKQLIEQVETIVGCMLCNIGYYSGSSQYIRRYKELPSRYYELRRR